MSTTSSETTVLQDVVIKFAGDSGDGMQLTGSQFTNNTALLGIDLATLVLLRAIRCAVMPAMHR